MESLYLRLKERDMSHYIVLIHKEPDSAYGVSVPDLPGCISASDISLDDALKNSTQAIAGYVETLVDLGRPVPEPRTLEQLEKDSEFIESAKGAIIATVPLMTKFGKTMRVNITLDENTLKLIDREAKLLGMTRSAFLAEAATEKIAV